MKRTTSFKGNVITAGSVLVFELELLEVLPPTPWYQNPSYLMMLAFAAIFVYQMVFGQKGGAPTAPVVPLNEARYTGVLCGGRAPKHFNQRIATFTPLKFKRFGSRRIHLLQQPCQPVRVPERPDRRRGA